MGVLERTIILFVILLSVARLGLRARSSQLHAVNVLLVRTQPPGAPVKVELLPCHA